MGIHRFRTFLSAIIAYLLIATVAKPIGLLLLLLDLLLMGDGVMFTIAIARAHHVGLS